MATLQDLAAGVGPSGNYIGTPGNVWLGGAAPQAYVDDNGKTYYEDPYQHQFKEDNASQALRDAQDEKDKQDYRNWQISNRMQQAMDGIQKDATGATLDSQLSDRLFKASQDIMGIDFKTGMNIMEQASKYSDKASQASLEALNVKKAQMEVAGNILGGISDEDSFQKARVALAGLDPSFAIPPQYQTFNKDAQSFIANRQQFTPKGIAAMKAKIAEQQAAINEASLQLKINKDTREQQAADSKEAAARNPKVKTLTLEQQAGVQSELSTYLPDTWDNIKDSTSKTAAASEWYNKVAQYQAQGKDQDTAKALAAKDVNSMISSDGVFTPKQVSATAPNSSTIVASPKSQSDFDALPSGSLYINPADGKQYRKK